MGMSSWDTSCQEKQWTIIIIILKSLVTGYGRCAELVLHWAQTSEHHWPNIQHTHTHTEHQIILNACLSNTYILAACKWRKTGRIISVTFKYLLITQMLPASQWTHLTIWLYYTCFWCLDISLQSVSGGNRIAVDGIALPQSYPPTL